MMSTYRPIDASMTVYCRLETVELLRSERVKPPPHHSQNLLTTYTHTHTHRERHTERERGTERNSKSE